MAKCSQKGCAQEARPSRKTCIKCAARAKRCYERTRQKRAESSRKWKRENRRRVLEVEGLRRNRNPKRIRAIARKSHLKKKYGLTLQDYDAMLAAQGGHCKLCGTSNPGTGNGYFCVDHLHLENAEEVNIEQQRSLVRGLLCSTCNISLSVYERLSHYEHRIQAYLNQRLGNEKWDRRFLMMAQHISTFSKDPSTKVGAVIVRPNLSVASVGYNGFPRGVDDTPERLGDRETKYKLVVHAERNAIVFARQDLSGCVLYTWPFMPCAPCAGMVVQAGITEVVAPRSENPRWEADWRLAEQVFREAKVALRLLEDG